MKTLALFIVLTTGIFNSIQSHAQTAAVKETIQVWGNCGMCKKTIEKSAQSAGASAADWSEESKELTVSFDPAKTSATKIQEAIARSGYDTRDLTADDKSYNNLPHCCQYERKSVNNPETSAGSLSTPECCKDRQACKEMDECQQKDCCKM